MGMESFLSKYKRAFSLFCCSFSPSFTAIIINISNRVCSVKSLLKETVIVGDASLRTTLLFSQYFFYHLTTHNCPFIMHHRMSNTHLIGWRNIILDFHTATNIRAETARGAAAKSLCGVSMIGVVTTSLGEGEDEGGRVKGIGRIERGLPDEIHRGVDRETGKEKGNWERDKDRDRGMIRSSSTVIDISEASGSGTVEGAGSPPLGWNSGSGSDSDNRGSVRNIPCKSKSTAQNARTASYQESAMEKNKKGKIKFGDIRSVCDNVCAVLDVPPGVRDRDITFTLRGD